MNGQLARAWAVIASSRESIARSKKCIDAAMLIVGQPSHGVSLAGVGLTEVQQGEWLERQQACAEQREIEREVRRTAHEQRLSDLA